MQWKAPAEPQVAVQIAAIAKKYDEAANKNDAVALGALFSEDAVFLADTGPVYGRRAIEEWYAGLFQQWHIRNHVIKADLDSPRMIGIDGNQAWLIGEWSQSQILKGQTGTTIKLNGYWSAIDNREGNDWKIQMLTCNIAPAQ